MYEQNYNPGGSVEQKHHRQSLWQIWLPLGLTILFVSGLFYATLIITQTGSMDLGQVQNTAVVLLILPLAFLGLISLLALVLVIIATSKLFAVIPRLRVVSNTLYSISGTVTGWSNRLMMPFVFFHRIRNRMDSKRN